MNKIKIIFLIILFNVGSVFGSGAEDIHIERLYQDLESVRMLIRAKQLHVVAPHLGVESPLEVISSASGENEIDTMNAVIEGCLIRISENPEALHDHQFFAAKELYSICYPSFSLKSMDILTKLCADDTVSPELQEQARALFAPQGAAVALGLLNAIISR